MTPFADFSYFGILLYVAVPTVALGLLRRAGRHWILITTALMLFVQYWGNVQVGSHWHIHEYYLVLLWTVYQVAISRCFARMRARGNSRITFYCVIAAVILPVFVSRLAPHGVHHIQLGFLGLSYVTFRALDLIFCIQDRVVTQFSLAEYFAFLLFFPTLSSGPIDRLRRFRTDWTHARSRDEFLKDLGECVHRIFGGFLYKFILAALINRYWLEPAAAHHTFLGLASYMYAYALYLFFDFAGYSAFAIGVSYLLGIHTPENFNKPFLAPNIREFWNRWHMSLSFWFRDHVYMRFVMAAVKGKWFKNKHTPSAIGYFLSFGLMGLWHGFTWYYALYGLYMGLLLSAYDVFTRWCKRRKFQFTSPWWRMGSVLITFHAVAFGFLIFSGHLTVGR